MDSPPALFTLMFGEQAKTAFRNASERLLRWAGWFEDWLDERVKMEGKGSLPRTTWGGFLGLTRKTPWEAQQSDVLAFMDSMRQQGKNDGQVRKALIELASFYGYAGAGGEDVVDPTAGIKRPEQKRGDDGVYLDDVQVQALLEAVRGDDQAIARRDYALILMQLTTPLRPRELRLLHWFQLDLSTSPGAAWVPKRASRLTQPAFRPGKKGWVRKELAAEPVAALLEWLEAAGRLKSMQRLDFIFCPTALDWGARPVDLPEGWNAQRPLSDRALRERLRHWAELAGLQVRELNWNSLRYTAILQRVVAGEGVEAIHSYFGAMCLSNTYELVSRLKRKARKAAWMDEAQAGHGAGDQAESGGGNSFYAPAIPAADLARLEQFHPNGVEGEVDSLRVLMYHSLKHALESKNQAEMVRLIEAISSATQRMANSLKVQRELSGKTAEEEFSWAEITRSILEEAGWEES